MKVALLLITHGNLGRDLLDTVSAIFGSVPLEVRTISVANDCDPDATFEQADAACALLDQGAGVLVLTDLYGSTPSNIANRLAERHHVIVVSGVNAPMLLRILNYADGQLETLGEIAVSGARNGIILTTHMQAS
jgi:PTS system ascorbate-specific IIA component